MSAAPCTSRKAPMPPAGAIGTACALACGESCRGADSAAASELAEQTSKTVASNFGGIRALTMLVSDFGAPTQVAAARRPKMDAKR
ncbi:MAG: hypothetical protein R3C10_16950 [Pirellulales bacterium]